MNLNNISLPYPVLGISDDIVPLLPEDSVSVELIQDVRNYKFLITLKFTNNDISKLVENGQAAFSCEYECPKTMLRCCKKNYRPFFEIEIPTHNINGRVIFNCFVSVKKPISNYKNKGFNDDYEGLSFNMEIGDILVAFPQFHYDADIKYDKLQAAGSFMQIRDTTQHEEVFFDITGNKIEILLPQRLYQLYCNPQVKGAAEIIHSSLVLNALTYALININDHEQTTWAKTILYRMKNENAFSNVDIEEISTIPSIAQRLLKDPYGRLFNNIMSHDNKAEE